MIRDHTSMHKYVIITPSLRKTSFWVLFKCYYIDGFEENVMNAVLGIYLITLSFWEEHMLFSWVAAHLLVVKDVINFHILLWESLVYSS